MQQASEQNTKAQNFTAIRELLAEVCDPEVPVLSILDLGIVRDVRPLFTNSGTEENGFEILITPTYSGCPAMDAITVDIKLKLLENGYRNFKITSTLSPAWTTDWMTEEGKQKLKNYGIAPPSLTSRAADAQVQCPQCHSVHTKLLSQFGSTACKALYQCMDCREPFDHFKCH